MTDALEQNDFGRVQAGPARLEPLKMPNSGIPELGSYKIMNVMGFNNSERDMQINLHNLHEFDLIEKTASILSYPAPARASTANRAGKAATQFSFTLHLPAWAYGFIVPVVLGVIWELAVRAGLVQARLMPPPSRVADTLFNLARSGDLLTHSIATLSRVGLGFAIGAAAATLAGAVCGVSLVIRRLLDPLIQALRAIPSIAWVPLFILWLGIFENSKIMLIAVGVFFPVYLGVLGAIDSVDRKLVEVGRAFRLSRTALVFRILLPASLPEWITALRSGLGLGFMFVVAAEFMGASEGLGYLLVDGQQLGKPDQILAAILAFAILGKTCDAALVFGTKPLIAWQDRVRDRL
jgi:sulfonate transport system permease protein